MLLCIIVSWFLLKIQAIEVFGAERIGHGYRVLEDETVYQLTREKNIHFEVYTSHVTVMLYSCDLSRDISRPVSPPASSQTRKRSWMNRMRSSGGL